MTDTNIIDKTVVVKFTDALDMLRFCNETDADDAPVSKKFLDWYLIDGTFTIPAGMLIIEEIHGHKDRTLALSFDFGDVEYPEFILYNYKTREQVTSVRFCREDNLDMVHLKFILRKYDPKKFDRIEDCYFGAKSDHLKMKRELALLERQVFKLKSNKKQQSMFRKKAWEIHHRLHYSLFGLYIQMVYAAQFSFIHNPPQEITSDGSLVDVNSGKKIKTIYKYTGYVNLADRKVYKYEDRDPDAPVRDYQRHIQRWTVRGHYRRQHGKLIWIEPHTKGKGELEQRIYGTLDEDEVDVIPKVFVVERNVPGDDRNILTPESRIISGIKENESENKILHKNGGESKTEVVTTPKQTKKEKVITPIVKKKRAPLFKKILQWIKSILFQ